MYVSIYLSIYLSMDRSIDRSIYRYVYVYMDMYVYITHSYRCNIPKIMGTITLVVAIIKYPSFPWRDTSSSSFRSNRSSTSSCLSW